MLDYHAASDRAVWFAIESGEMPSMYLIHEIQRSEGFEPCFGRAVTFCDQTQCRWHSQCMALQSFQRKPEPRRLSDSRNPQARTMNRTTLGNGDPRPSQPERHRSRTEPATVDSP